jgi:hypothetical protein
MKPPLKSLIIAVALAVSPLDLFAQGVMWTHWSATNVNSASGNLGGIAVSYSGEVGPATIISNNGIYHWSPASTFTNSLVVALPDTSDWLTLSGGVGITNRITFASPITNLVMDIASVGSINSGITAYYNFDHSFTILSQGGDYWHSNGIGCSLTSSGNSLVGLEGSGCLLFTEPITSLTWTVPVTESYSGFNFGSASIDFVPEPSALTLIVIGGSSLSLLTYCSRKYRCGWPVRDK